MIADKLLAQIDSIISKIKIADRTRALYAILIFMAFVLGLIVYLITTPQMHSEVMHLIYGWRHS